MEGEEKKPPSGIYFMDEWGIAIGLSVFLQNQAGIVTTRSFDQGEFIFPVRGVLVGEPTKYSFAFTRDKNIEPERTNGTYNPGHFLNHSCDPNVIVRPTYQQKLPVIEVIARRSIDSGSELTFDYATLEYDVTVAGTPCHCGSALCRGHIHGFKDMPREVKQRYLEEGGIIAQYLLET